jgi:outer membrane protein TolC
MKQRSASSKWLFSLLGIIALVLAFTSGPPPVIAQQSDSSSQKAAAASGDAEFDLPLSPVEKAEKDGTALKMSLKDLTKLALQNNLDIAIQDTNEQATQHKIRGAQGAYDLTMGQTSLSWGKSRSYNTSANDRSTTDFGESDSASWRTSLTQKVKTGGQFQLSFNGGRSDSNSTNQTFSPRYSSNATLSFTQPLIKNFRIDDSRKNIKVVNLNAQTTDSQFKQQVTSIIADIQTQYWTLVSAIKDYEIKRNSVRLGMVTLRDNKKRKEVGTLAPIGVTESEYDLANRQLQLITSEENILRQENALRNLISINRNSEIWSQVIIPTDTPDFQEYKVELSTAIATALKNRPEIEQSDIQIKLSELDILSTKNSRKWGLDASFQFGSQGVSGPQGCERDNNPVSPNYGQCAISPITGKTIDTIKSGLVGGFGNSIRTLFNQNITNWQLGFSISVPLRSRSLDATLAQQMISQRQTLLQRRKQEQSIQVEIRNAVQKLSTNRAQVETAKKGRELSEEQLSGEQKRFDAGLSENYKVLQRQNDLASAENTYLSNLITYKQSVIALQKSMYTLLEANEFEMSKGSSTKVPDLK